MLISVADKENQEYFFDIFPEKTFSFSSERVILLREIPLSLRYDSETIEEAEKLRKILEDINKLEELFNVIFPKKLRIYLQHNYFLIDFIKEAYMHIKRIFGEEVIIKLELDIEPEENFEELFIVVISPYSPEITFEKKRQLDREWFLSVTSRLKGKINILLEIK